MAHDEQLAWEARAGRPAAAAAFGAAVIGFGGYIMYQSAIADRPDGADGYLQAVKDNSGALITASVVQAIGMVLLAPALLYLYKATRHRRQQLTQAAATLLVLGAVTLAGVTLIQQFKVVDVADSFFPFTPAEDASSLTGDAYAEAVDPDKAAEERIRDEISPALTGVGIGGTLALAFAIVMIALNAMRAGLLSRFMGILGVAMGVLFVIPLGVQPILQFFWFGAVGALYLGRWPGGRGPAWQTGEAIPWPGAAEQRAEIERRRDERDGAGEEDGASGNGAGAPDDAAAARPASRKRRKKRR